MSNQHENKSSFESRLAGYALACGAAVLGASQADAGIVYSGPLNQSYGPVPETGIADDTNTVLLDVNGDGDLDFSAINILDDQSSPADGVFDVVFGLTASSGAVVVEDIGGTPFASNLAEGTPINGGSSFGKAGKLSFDTLPTPTIGALLPWNAGATGYVGFGFLANGGADAHFGWVELEIGSGYEVILKGWAYEDVPEAEILAGATPEPTSLALLACGAAGVIALNAARKRRSSSAV